MYDISQDATYATVPLASFCKWMQSYHTKGYGTLSNNSVLNGIIKILGIVENVLRVVKMDKIWR